MKYSDDQIMGIFGHKASGVQRYFEAEGDPTPQEKKDAEKPTPKYRTIKVGEDKVDIDLENDLVYINDELVTPDADTPKHIIDVLRKAVPQVLKGGKEEEKGE